VGFSWAHELAARPVVVPDIDAAYATNIYQSAKRFDEWPGENYEGSSVLGGAKAVVDLGHLNEYRWAFGLDDLIMAVGYKGPAVLGINWYEGMFAPDSRGYINVAGDIAGGHAILCNGVSVSARRFRLHNSWGMNWGMGGDTYISFADMERLLYEDGESCIPVKRV
jgi:hypothetical protein